MKVTRWTSAYPRMKPSGRGGWVKYQDYRKLLQNHRQIGDLFIEALEVISDPNNETRARAFLEKVSKSS